MPFDVGAASRFERRIRLQFNEEDLEVFYNAGEKYREYQIKAQQLDQEFNDLQHRLQRAASNVRAASSDEDTEGPSEERTDEAEKVYEDIKKAMAGARRRIADNVCTIITRWDLEGDLDYIKSLMPPKDQKANKDVTGHGTIPIDGAWLDAIPLPDEFILLIVQTITENFESGGKAGKGRLKAS